jgi:hypothetical protein
LRDVHGRERNLEIVGEVGFIEPLGTKFQSANDERSGNMMAPNISKKRAVSGKDFQIRNNLFIPIASEAGSKRLQLRPKKTNIVPNNS